MKRLIFATGNQNKMREIREILADLPVEILSMKEAGIEADIVEDGKTFEENAIIKAKTIMELTGELVLADDSGLEIDYLNKEPGIYSARYMGEDTSYRIKNTNLIERLTGVPDEKRTARFVCAIAAAFPDGTIKTTEGVIEGRSDMKNVVRMDLVMILSIMYRKSPVQQLNYQNNRRIQKATKEKPRKRRGRI